MGILLKNQTHIIPSLEEYKKNEKEIVKLRKIIDLLMDKLKYSLAYHPPKDGEFEIVDREEE